ncbi:MAG: GUN4 domain-containing protein [Trichodesmium sp. MAG_R03]|nr:GUN4 domain-containing protein [Trichodesmium sp. MAG_R03]
MSSDFEKYVDKTLETSLREELIGLYECESSSISFRTLIGDATFPIDKLPIDRTTWRDLITKFLSICQSLSLDKLNNIFFKLYNAHQGYQYLKTVSDILKKEVKTNNATTRKIETSQQKMKSFLNLKNSDGLTNNDRLNTEILNLYQIQVELFRTTITKAGFPIEQISDKEPLEVIIFQFLEKCKGLDDYRNLKIFKALYNKNRGSVIIENTVNYLEEICLKNKENSLNNIKINEKIEESQPIREEPKTTASPQKTKTDYTVNYTKLSNYLTHKEWKKADEETLNIMNEICEKQKDDFWNEEDINRISCSEILEIDKLWRESSNNNFGLTIQKNIWEKLESIDKEDIIQEKFAEKVGWSQNQEYLDWDQPSFKANVYGKKLGILPTPPPFTSLKRTYPGLIPFLVNKINDCQCDSFS